ncbi:MAG: TrkH family potassium uptake protein [Alphaproteobacteria bacterium]|nr:TrkH family potassium uptake protein [Alphaproteobacteria bacterium]MCB9795770.1 TrkH family potassium uptake protein [Alphaproteobacteria bacterium]
MSPASRNRVIPSEGRLNWGVVARPLGMLMAGLAIAMLGTGGIGLAMGSLEGAGHMGISAIAVALLAAVLLTLGRDTADQVVGRREALLIVTLSWLGLSVVGGLPFIIGADFSIPDAIFEAASGFTTTGATILPEIRERLNPALHFWRMLSHWLGGMGIVVLFVAVFPALGVGGKHLFRSEVPGPRSKGLAPRIRETSSVLWKVYLTLTLIEIGLLMFVARVPLFEAVVHALSTMGTGGFSTLNGSVAEFSAPSAANGLPADVNGLAVDLIILAFMVIAGMNFSLFYEAIRSPMRMLSDGLATRSPGRALQASLQAGGHLIRRAPSELFAHTETRVYLIILALASVVIALNIYSDHLHMGAALRYASFQVAAIMSTTGFGTADFEAWPTVAKMVLLSLYFTGGCAGSTAGGMKLIRVIILAKLIWVEMQRSFRPHLVLPVRVGKQAIRSETLVELFAFMGLYALTVAVGAASVALLDPVDGTTALMASLSCVANVGPGLGMVGPTDNFGFFSGASKLILSACMLLGRLEFLTILAIFAPGFRRS